MLAVSDCLVVGILHFFGQFLGQLEVLALLKIHLLRNYFPKKIHALLSIFFPSSNMFFIRLFLAKNLKTIGCHRACFLTDCRERWRDRSRDGEFARWGLGRDTNWCPSYSKYAIDIKLTAFGCFSTEIHTWKKCKNNKE